MKITAKITIDGVEHTVETRPVDLMKWEAASKKKITDGVGYSDMLQIFYSAAKRAGLADRPFTDWVEGIDDFDPVVTGADPTLTAPSTTE